VDWLAEKLAGLRIFEDAQGLTNLALPEVGGAVLLVPQFTLAADWRKGRRPSFTAAARPDEAVPLVARLAAGLASRGLAVEQGVFGAAMQVELVNDGPFTLVLDSRQRPGRET
jgi:D-tyrosyl-tRNA(Tyr) deacylase